MAAEDTPKATADRQVAQAYASQGQVGDGGGEQLQRLGDDIQRARIERLFHSLDQNKDGRIDPEELERGLEKMGYAHVNKEQIMQFLAKSDTSKTGDLDLSEFTDYLIRHERQLHFVFSTLDENRDGKLCIDEIMGAFKKMGIVITREEAVKLSKR